MARLRMTDMREVDHWKIYGPGQFELKAVVEESDKTRILAFFVSAKDDPAAESHAQAFIQALELQRSRR